MPHACVQEFWGYPADELLAELDRQYEAREGQRGWGLLYEDPLAYLACVNVLGGINDALGWKTQTPGDWLGEFFPPGTVKEWANATAGSLALDRLDDSVPMNLRHSATAFGWSRTNSGNNPNPEAATKLRAVHRRIRDVLDILRLDDKGNPIPEGVLKRGRKRKGRRHPRHGKGRGACPCCALREMKKDPVRERWMRLLRPKARRKARRRR